MYEKLRIIQESVPGKQVTLAHIIANPDVELYRQLGLTTTAVKGAIGIVTITPGETAIIAADVALKASGVSLGFIDRVSGTLLLTGSLSEVQASLRALTQYVQQKLDFNVCEVTTT